MNKGIIVRFEQSRKQTVGDITKIIGLLRAKSLIPIIDYLNLEANPRASITGAVTDAIQETIRETPQLLPFKTKGILLAASYYEELERDRIRIVPKDIEVEGILDGGHNTLAIGLYILEIAMEYDNKKLPKGKKTWSKFKDLWKENRNSIEKYLEAIRNDEMESISENLKFLIPVELLVPRDVNDEKCMSTFKNELFDICEARNNNVELQTSAKANQKGYFDDFKSIMQKENEYIASRIEWKTNDGGEIKVQDILALTWIPLNLVENIVDENNKKVEPISPNKIYSSKGSCLKQFEKFMSSPNVTMSQSNDYKAELKNPEVVSAFRIAAKMPELYDYIYENFPDLYNKNGGSYGRITSVKKLNEKRKNYKTPYTGKEVSSLSPDGFIMPLVYGLQALMERKIYDNGKVEIRWRNNIDPIEFLDKNLIKIVKRYMDIFPLCDYDPQKIGKTSVSYTNAIDAYKMALVGLLD